MECLSGMGMFKIIDLNSIITERLCPTKFYLLLTTESTQEQEYVWLHYSYRFLCSILPYIFSAL